MNKPFWRLASGVRRTRVHAREGPIQNVLGRLLISQDFLPRSVTTGRFCGTLRNKGFSRASVTTGRWGTAWSAKPGPSVVLAGMCEPRVPIAPLYLADDAMEAWYHPSIA